MKTIRIEASVEIPLIGGKKGEKGVVKLILEIPYSKSLFKDWERAEELSESLIRAKEVLRKKGIKTGNKEDVFTKNEKETYGPVLQQLVDYLASTQTTGASSQAILQLLCSHLEQARIEAIEIIERDTKEAEKYR